MQIVWSFCDGGDKGKHAKQNPPQNIEFISDIPYIDEGNYYHKPDVIYPNNISENNRLSVIIDIHGSGQNRLVLRLKSLLHIALSKI